MIIFAGNCYADKGWIESTTYIISTNKVILALAAIGVGGIYKGWSISRKIERKAEEWREEVKKNQHDVDFGNCINIRYILWQAEDPGLKAASEINYDAEMNYAKDYYKKFFVNKNVSFKDDNSTKIVIKNREHGRIENKKGLIPLQGNYNERMVEYTEATVYENKRETALMPRAAYTVGGLSLVAAAIMSAAKLAANNK